MINNPTNRRAEMSTTPLSDELERLRISLGQERTPAYGDALALCRRLEVGMAWQPMGTAPKNGIEVLLAVKRRAGITHGLLVGHWMPAGSYCDEHPPIDEGWYFWNGTMFDKAAEPTAWMMPAHHPEWAKDGWQVQRQTIKPPAPPPPRPPPQVEWRARRTSNPAVLAPGWSQWFRTTVPEPKRGWDIETRPVVDA